MLSLFAHRLAHRCTRVKFPSFGGVHKQSNLASSNALVDKTPSSSNTDSELENGVEADYFLDGRQHSPHLKKSPILLTDNPIEKKIIYNSLAYSITVDKTPFIQRVKKHKEIMMKEQHSKNRAFLAKEVDSIVAKLMNSKTEKDDERCDNGIIENEKRPDEVSFPYQTYTPISRKVERFKSQLELEMENNLSKLVFSENTNYGTEDPSVAASETPCGGCGAFLHCQSASLPGYLPSEIFTSCDVHQLRGQICQRCRFLREHNVALSVQISPEDYPKVISAIRNEIAMVILVVDLTDFPCSIWPGLLDIIGSKRPVCVVGNKVDLIPKDSKGYLNQMKQSLIMELEKCGLNRANIKHVSLISATTGYGVEQLITKIQNSWGYRGDVYLLGCTNVGKSSIFNALINSDFCKVQAIDVLERATVSPWPGTTLNLLKFPMLRPSGIRLYERTKRLLAEQTIELAEQKIRQEQLKETRNPKFATLIGHIGRTFDLKKSESEDVQDPFSIKADKVPGEEENIFNPNHKYYRESKWCYDTPGTVNPEQILTLLTIEELMMTLPKKIIKPRTLLIRPGTAYFLAGLGRIDYLEGPHSLLFTTFSSAKLPLTMIPIEDADEMYKELLGTPVLTVPTGGPQRLAQWPGLSGKNITFRGVGWKECAVDLVLSSAGWVSVTGEEGREYELKVYTPEMKGIYVRSPPLLPHSVMLRGNRLERSPAFSNNRLCI